MERNEIGSSKDGGGGDGEGVKNYSKSSDGFIDRSRVRILLCDNDSKDSEEVFTLLCKCSYQVTSVRSPRQVVDALNAEGPDIDIILSEVDLPMSKGLKMLKYIMRDKELRRIPVIMMSAQDEVPVVVKCLKLGAADYLVKPLRTNELLNLWTHMWRRRRMLGLEEKNILSYDLDMVGSDPSDANTNSTNLFSDDTDDKSRKISNPEVCVSTHQQDETAVVTVAAPVETSVVGLLQNQPDAPESIPWQKGHILSCPKKNELKIGECSAFFTYVKSSALKIDSQMVAPKLGTLGGELNFDAHENVNEEAKENQYEGNEFVSSNITPDSLCVERSCTSPQLPEFSQQRDSNIEEISQVYMHPRHDSNLDVSGFNAHTSYPYYISGLMNQYMMPSMYQNNPQDLQNLATLNMLPQYNQYQHCPPHVPQMASFPYYPIRLCLPPGQNPGEQPWPSYGGSSSSTDGKSNKVDRREAALLKFRQKRKERCFDKKIRYANRKQLVKKRSRVRGQFVLTTSADYDDDDYDDEELADRYSSPEDNASGFQ
ncbi:hypothetical protein LguiB_007925 [Lonicera macranthoides]